MDRSVLRRCVTRMLLPALVAVGCTIEGLPPDPQQGPPSAGAGGTGGAASPDDSPNAGDSAGGETSTPGPGDEGGGSSAQATGGSAEAGQDAAGASAMHSGGAAQTGGVTGQGAFPAGGRAASGGAADGGAGTGGTDGPGSGGSAGTGGVASGGSGGMATGGRRSTGGSAETGGIATGGKGGTATGGAPTGGSGGAASGGASSTGGSSAVDCSGTMPTGGTDHCGANTQGTAAGLSWSLWSNGDGACMTTYSSPAFSASWNDSSDTLARLGLEFGNAGQTYEQYGTITAQFALEKAGTGGSFSAIGVYGWSENPCVEFYIVDDSFSRMPINPDGTTDMGTAEIDGDTYRFYTRPMSGTVGCAAGVSNWIQFYSIRQTARQCGQISVTEHFDAWKTAGMTLGELLEVTILIEVLGGSGSIDFSTANVTAQ